MSYKSRRNRRITAVLGTAIGLMLVFTFVLSLLNIDPTSQSSIDESGLPTVTPFGQPTPVIVPTPEPDPQLDRGDRYMHSSGYFQTFLPVGSDWLSSEFPSAGDAAVARVVIQSGARLALFHNFVVPGVEYDSLGSLSESFLTPAYFNEAWIDYDSWEEVKDPQRTITNDQVIIDFTLVAEGNEYLGRAVHELRDGWLYATRVVVPANNPALFDRLTGWVGEAFQPFPQMQALPVGWPVYYDRTLGYMVKYPANWTLVAGSEGAPVTLEGTNSSDKIRVRVVADTVVDSVDAAQAWVQTAEPDATILDAGTLARTDGTNGFEVAYSFRDTAGDAHSGLVVLLSREDSSVVVANLQLDAPGVNLMDVAGLLPVAAEARQAVTDGFMLLP